MIQITIIIDGKTVIKIDDVEIFISGDFEIKKKGAEAPVVNIKENKFSNDDRDSLPPHEFPLLNHQEYQRIYKEALQEVPKEDYH